MRVIEVDAGVSLPVAFGGLRKILQAVGERAPKTFARVVAESPSVWNRLFPGSVRDAPDLSDLALSPSERRLHRESEQIFWILNTAARTLLDGLREADATLKVLHAGASDLVSLRALMRALEWARLERDDLPIQLEGWSARGGHQPQLFAARRDRFLQSLQDRMRTGTQEVGAGNVLARNEEPAVDLEGSYLRAVIDGALAPEHRLAAAVLAIRSCFFSTNYEGAMLAAEHGLRLCAPGTQVHVPQLLAAWDSLDSGLATAAIEIDRDNLGDADELRALFHRSAGVVFSFSGENELAMEHFGHGLECKISPERKGQLRMFRALSLIKRMDQLPNARAEAQIGVDGLADRQTPDGALHEAWLRNVMALTFFQEKKFDEAVAQEMRAIKCVADLHTASATHLKINLITNLSVLQETARRLPDAITTWRKFEKTIEHWDTNFYKHHRYRLAALHRLNNELPSASERYAEAFSSAEKLGDSFHRQVIASDLGRVLLESGQREEAASWYRRSFQHARELGDPYRMAEGLAGEQVALHGPKGDFSEVARHARMSSTFSAEAAKLLAAVQTGEEAPILAALPKARSKLNRPFDLVNLY